MPSTVQTTLQTKALGNSALHITPVGFGAWAIGVCSNAVGVADGSNIG
jgi:aryl-alcohol dehydrogenase-like predicted oxidoreductase